jgi:polyhydroxybutyrate depolymerase
MRKILMMFICIPFFSIGQQTINDSININGIYRSFITYIPLINQPSEPTPLVFNLHGMSSNALQQMIYGDFRGIADTANFIIVHPQGLLNITGETHWNLGQSSVDDIGFLNSLYSYIVSNYNINLDKVYSTGMSNGGYMSYFLACNMSDKIAAIASVTGAMGSFTQLNCNPTHPTPVMEIHGTADSNVLFNEIFNGLEYWRDYNNCNLIADTTVILDFNFEDLSSVEHIVYNNGDNGVTTELFKIINGGHTWPGSSISIGATNYDIDASIEIWKFFSRYDINGVISQPTIIYEQAVNKELIKVIDLFGRESKGLRNQPLLYIYDDGTVEQKIIFE